MKEFELTISVVLYQNDPAEIEQLIACIADTELNYRLYLIDNSPHDSLRIFAGEKNTEYFFNNKNIGFGHAQNIAIAKAMDRSKYHLIINPDITFEKGTLENIFVFMEENADIGQLMPKVFYPDGEVQKLCKLLPHPLDLIGRRFFGNLKLMQQRNAQYELSNFCYNKILDTPNLSGCFMFIRTNILKQAGGFDTRFFMYLEDFDLTRRINKVARTVFYPGASVVHGFGKGSYKNKTLFRYHMVSAVKYFNKWGWLFDRDRSSLNKKVLAQL
ncbi:MAG: glycosyltransferase family 2 protein [Panacibacter sp.]